MGSSSQEFGLSPELGYLTKSKKVLDRLDEGYSPDKIYALVSGGHDSDTALQVAHESEKIDLDGVAHINTGCGIPETRDYVKERCLELDLPYHELCSIDTAGFLECSVDQKIREDNEKYPDLVTHYHEVRDEGECYS